MQDIRVARRSHVAVLFAHEQDMGTGERVSTYSRLGRHCFEADSRPLPESFIDQRYDVIY
jgi:hypothetical protein